MESLGIWVAFLGSGLGAEKSEVALRFEARRKVASGERESSAAAAPGGGLGEMSGPKVLIVSTRVKVRPVLDVLGYVTLKLWILLASSVMRKRKVSGWLVEFPESTPSSSQEDPAPADLGDQKTA